MKYFAKMANGWDIEIGANLYNRIKAGLSKYPSGGSTLANSHLLKDGSIIIGKYLVGIEAIPELENKSEDETADETYQFVAEISGESQEAPSESDYGLIMPLSELDHVFQESKLTHKEFADRIDVASVAHLKRILDGGSPITAKITKKVNEFTVVGKDG